MPPCYYHPQLPGFIVCSRCGRSICDSCYKPYLDLALCPDCFYKTVPRPLPSPVPSPMPAHVPVPSNPGFYGGFHPPGWYGPFLRYPFLIRHWWLPIVLLGIAAGLIFFNGIALLSPVFFAVWVALFPWVAPLGTFAFILGAILGLILFGALLMILLGFRVLAAFMIIPTAIASFFIGGGFIAGLIIGVLAAILVILRDRFP